MQLKNSRLYRLFLLVFALSIGHTLCVPMAAAGMIGTEALMPQHAAGAGGAPLDADAVRNQLFDGLVSLGVAPQDARARVNALNGQELALASDKLNELPAGGSVIYVIGVVFVVLIILELVGVTNIFRG